MNGKCIWICVLAGLALAGGAQVSRPRVLENLGRGVVAVRVSETSVYVGWRLLGTDPADIAFDVYRSTNGGPSVRLNAAPLATTTDFLDITADLTKSNMYTARPAVEAPRLAAGPAYTLTANAPVRQYLEIPLQVPDGGKTSDGQSYTYSANDGSVGDLDGDGEYEIVLKWDPSNSRDTASTGYSGPVVLDAYKLDGTLLWRINLGRNIRAGAHYTQFMVYDLDGDGKAEVAAKTADATVDGKGRAIGDPAANWVSTDSRTLGRVLDGPEYLTIFDGETGAALATTDYIPPRGDLGAWGGVGGNCGNDSVGNRVDRFLAAVAYLDGVGPSLVMARGYYGRSVLAAWDWRSGKLSRRWVFDSVDGANAYSGQGNHNLSVADVDFDGKDEIIYGSMVVDDNGKGLFSTGLRHGDALHAGDLVPSRPGLEVWGIHENEVATCAAPGKDFGAALYDAADGSIIFGAARGVDVGRGVAADIDPRHPGAEFWASGLPLMDEKGERLADAPSSANFLVWWDADPLREILDSNWIKKWDWNSGAMTELLTAAGCASNNGSKATPVLSADILGDWREEVIWRTSDNKSLRIYTTTIPAKNRIYTLMHDPQYRLAIAWQNVAYNQPPHPSFFLGDGMKTPPRPGIAVVFRRSPPPRRAPARTWGNPQ